MNAVRLDDFEAIAREHLSADVFDHFAAGAGDEATLRDNLEGFARLRLLGRVLRDVSARDLSTSLLGDESSMPVLLAPVPQQQLAHDDGEVAMARAAAAAGVVRIASALAGMTIEDTTRASSATTWFHVEPFRDRGLTAELLRRAAAAGCRAIVLTVDSPVDPGRDREARRGGGPCGLRYADLEACGLRAADASHGWVQSLVDPAFDWNDFSRLVASTDLPVVAKGILHPDDARLAVAHGAAAVFVSNHGGRRLDGAPATIDVLAAVAEAVDGRAEVYLDGGIRRGSDVAKALSLGARAVGVGRPAVWALAAGGQRGVVRMLELLRRETDAVLAMCGASSPGALRAGTVV